MYALITRGSRALRPAKQPRRRPSPRRQSPYAPSAAPIGPANAVVASVSVLGLGTVAMTATQSLITRGPRASRPAKQQSLRRPQRRHAPHAAPLKPANTAVVLMAVLGTIPVEIPTTIYLTTTLITRGSRAFRHA